MQDLLALRYGKMRTDLQEGTSKQRATGSPGYKMDVNSWLLAQIMWVLARLYRMSGFGITVGSSASPLIILGKHTKRKRCDDDIRYMFNRLLELRRDTQTALMQVTVDVSHTDRPIKILDTQNLCNDEDGRDFDTISEVSNDLKSKIYEKIKNIVNERPIASTKESVMVQEVHSVEDQDLKDYLEEFRKLIRW